MQKYTHQPGKQVFIYALIGLFQLLVDAALFQVLVLAQLDAVIANFLSRFTAAMVGFLGHKWFTFRAPWKLDRARAVIRFVAWWVTATLIGGLVLREFTDLATSGLTLPLLKIAVELATAAVSFVVLRFWVFTPRRSRGHP